jgi:hypothetical protein
MDNFNSKNPIIAEALKGNTKEQVVGNLWHAFNTKDSGYRAKVAGEIADYLIENTTMTNYMAETRSEKVERAKTVLNRLSTYIRNINLSPYTNKGWHAKHPNANPDYKYRSEIAERKDILTRWHNPNSVYAPVRSSPPTHLPLPNNNLPVN